MWVTHFSFLVFIFAASWGCICDLFEVAVHLISVNLK